MSLCALSATQHSSYVAGGADTTPVSTHPPRLCNTILHKRKFSEVLAEAEHNVDDSIKSVEDYYYNANHPNKQFKRS